MTLQFPDMTSMSNLFEIVLFLLSSLVIGLSFMSISSLVLELWQFSFIRDWPEIRKSEIPPSKFCPISGDWGELWIPNLAWMSLIECYWQREYGRKCKSIICATQLGGCVLLKMFWKFFEFCHSQKTVEYWLVHATKLS